MVSFAVQKFLSLTRSHMFIFGIHYLGDGSKNIAVTYVKNVPFSSWSFRVSSFMFKSLIHFEFSFVYGDREYSNFTLWHVAVQFSQHHLLKRLSFLYCIFLFPLLLVNWS